MSELSKFLAKSKVIEIDGKKIEIFPLKVKDIGLFDKENYSKEEQMKLSKKLINLSLEKSMPNITDEEIDNLSVSIFTKIMNTINEVNGFGENEGGIRKIKEKIAQARTK